jgi:putative ABC transport system permease protein
MTLQFSLALRYLSGRKLRTFLTTLAVIFGVLVIFGMNIVLPTMMAALQANVQSASGMVDFTVTQVAGESFSPSLLPAVAGIEGVRAASASLNRTVNLPADFIDKDPAKPDAFTALALVGVDPDAARAIRSYPVTSGRWLERTDQGTAVISQTLASALGVSLGGSFALPSVNGLAGLEVVGILPPRAAPGNEEVLVTLPQAQLMTGETGRINTIDVDISDPSAGEAERTEIRKKIQTAVGDSYQVGSLFSGADVFSTIKLAQAAFDLFGVLALFMGGFIIFNTFRTVVTERRRDIGMLRALGATRRTVIGAILVEGLIQGLVGSIIGLVFGYLLGAGVTRLASPLLSKFINITIGAPVVSPFLVVGCILLGVGVTVLAVIIPARSAGRVTPLEAMRPSTAEVRFTTRAGAGFIVGALVIAASALALLSGNSALLVPGALLFLVGLVLVAPILVSPLAGLFGRFIAFMYARRGTGDIASGNLKRQPSRVAVTASATMLGLAVIVALGGLISSLMISMGDVMRKNLGSDYLFIPPAIAIWGGDMGASPEFAKTLRAIDGVEAVSTLRFAGTAVNGQGVSLMGIDPAAFPKVSGLNFIEGNDSAYKEIGEERALIANGLFMTVSGARVGQTVQLLTPSGPRPYKIAALASDLLNAKTTTAYTSQANIAADFGKTEDIFLQLNLKRGADVGAADARIKAVSADYPQFQLIEGHAYFASLMEQFNAVFSAMYFLFGLLALPSLIAMINTLAIGVIERTREIGMIRAVGATRRQIQGMVLAEALLLASIGTAFGLLGGLYLGRAFVTAIRVIFPLSYVFPVGGIIAGAAFGLIFGALAAIVPARQAARLQIVEALRYE